MMIQLFSRTVLTYFIIVIATMIGALMAILGGVLMHPFCSFNNRVVRNWASIIIWASGTKVRVEGLDKLDKDQPYVYMPNHLSTFDILTTAKFFPGTVRFIAKKELFKIPILAQGMAAAGMIKIDRGNSDEARKTIKDAVKILENGVSIIIFPEGTRSRTGEIQRFKKGGFILALEGKIPIVPVSISGSQYVNRKNSLILRPGVIKIKILDPVSTGNMEMGDRNALLEKVRQQIIYHYDPEFNKR